MKKYFFLLYPETSFFKLIIDSIRIIVDPTQKNLSHITLKGPYYKRFEKLLKKDTDVITSKTLRIDGTGCFFSEKQTTVYLSCIKTNDLENVWRTKREKTYKEFHPHLTIYNGSDRHFAEELLTILNKYPLNIQFNIEKLSLYESKSSKNSLFNLYSEIDFKKISALTNSNLNEESIQELKNSERLEIVDKLCNSLVGKFNNTLYTS